MTMIDTQVEHFPKELEEHNQFTRTNITLVVQWFIFFATANYLMFGLFTQKLMEGTVHSYAPIYIGAGILVGVNLVALAFCLEAKRWFKSAGIESSELRLKMNASLEAGHVIKQNRFPHADYSRVLAAMSWTVCVMLIGWLCLATGLMLAQRSRSQQPYSITAE